MVIKFCTSVPGGDPESRPCTIVGKRPNLDKVPFTDVAPFLGNRVSEEVRVILYLGYVMAFDIRTFCIRYTF